MKYLDEWYRDGKIEICDFFEWLKKQTSEEWHLATVYTTLDGDQEVLWWVVNQPDCELSTALNIFWAGDPAGALDGSYSRIFLHGDRSGGLYKPLTSVLLNFQIMSRILYNVHKGFYKNKNIAFPPKEHPGFNAEELPKRLKMYRNAEQKLNEGLVNSPWNLPLVVAKPFDGRKAKSDYHIDQGCMVYPRYDLWCEQNAKSGDIWANPFD